MIQLERLHKRYGSRVVFEELSLQIAEGITVIRGPNGSGKSTLLRIIAGIERPTRGTVRVMGRPPRDARDMISYLGHRTGLYLHMSVKENLDFFARIHGGNYRDMVEKFGLSEYLDYPLKKLSRGNLQKVGLVRALMKDVPVYLLDEPTTALDSRSRRIFGELISSMKDRIVVIATHEDLGVKSHVEIDI